MSVTSSVETVMVFIPVWAASHAASAVLSPELRCQLKADARSCLRQIDADIKTAIVDEKNGLIRTPDADRRDEILVLNDILRARAVDIHLGHGHRVGVSKLNSYKRPGLQGESFCYCYYLLLRILRRIAGGRPVFSVVGLSFICHAPLF